MWVRTLGTLVHTISCILAEYQSVRACSPNCEVRTVSAEGVRRVVLVSLREIRCTTSCGAAQIILSFIDVFVISVPPTRKMDRAKRSATQSLHKLYLLSMSSQCPAIIHLFSLGTVHLCFQGLSSVCRVGEELSYDYRLNPDPDKAIRCRCRSKRCRGWL
jgi:hypothetical protein